MRRSGSIFCRWHPEFGFTLWRATNSQRENTIWKHKPLMLRDDGVDRGLTSWLIRPGDTPPSRWFARWSREPLSVDRGNPLSLSAPFFSWRTRFFEMPKARSKSRGHARLDAETADALALE